MSTDAALAYLDLPADTRMEVRLPSLLKEHAEVVAASLSEKLSQFVVEALAEKVSEELATVRVWKLTLPEQAELLRILASKPARTPALTKATRRAEKLFGKAALR